MATRDWGDGEWASWRQAVFTQGLAPHLHRLVVRDTALARALPESARAWLAEQHAHNERRIRRMHDDLAALLGGAAAAGVTVMPLKGAFLSTLAGTDPHRRPMADLDLLVHRADRDRMCEIVEWIGYTRERDDNPRPTHDVFVDAGRGRIVSMTGEHPDNPRRVEVHVEVKRHLWGWDPSDDLTARLWAGAQPGLVLGRPAALPRVEDALAHLAIHASSDLLVGRGRLVQWLDLADLANRGAVAGHAGQAGPAESVHPVAVADMPHPRLAYPVLRLAERALPDGMSLLDLGALERSIPSRLVEWARTVPLDGRCGLQTATALVRPSSWGARWHRWAPLPWRLSVAYGDVPLPVALYRHTLNVAGVWGSRSSA